MAIYVVTGAPGTGKSLMAVSRIQRALWDGCRVATNMDLKLEGLVGTAKRREVTRLPDWPTADDFERLGLGYEGRGFSEKKFGLIVLDEAATFLNAREWAGNSGEENKEVRSRQARDRMRTITWLRQVRKFRWHLILITQELGGLDKQVRDALAEHVVVCKRLDRYAVPFISVLPKLIGLPPIRLPQVHVGIVRVGTSPLAPIGEKWWLLNARELHACYDTAQRYFGDNDGAASFLDASRAPWMWEPRGLWESAWKAFLWRWFPPSAARQAYDDFRLWEQGITPYKSLPPAAESWSEFERRTRAACEPSSGERPAPFAIAA